MDTSGLVDELVVVQIRIFGIRSQTILIIIFEIQTKPTTMIKITKKTLNHDIRLINITCYCISNSKRHENQRRLACAGVECLHSFHVDNADDLQRPDRHDVTD